MTKSKFLSALAIVTIVVASIYSFPYFSGLRSAMEMPRLFQTIEMVDHHSLSLNASYAELRRGSMIDVAHVNGHLYPNKAPGSSFFAIPGYWLAKTFFAISGQHPVPIAVTMWICRFSTATLPFLVVIFLLWRLLRQFVAPSIALLATVATTFGSMMFPNALIFFSSVPAAVALFGAYWVLEMTPSLTRKHLVAIGALLGLAVVFDYESVIGVVIIFVAVCQRTQWRLRSAAMVIAGGVPFAVALGAYHAACFGSPFRTGYDTLAAHQRPVVLIGPNRPALDDILLSPSNGLFVLMPWTIIAILAGVAALLNKRDGNWRRIALISLVITLGTILFVGSIQKVTGVRIGGWSAGPRYLMIAIPFLGLLFAFALDRVKFLPELFGAFVGLALVGATTMVTAALFPHWPDEIQNPLYEASFPLLSAGVVPPNIGWLSGLRGAASIAPLYVLIGGLFLAPIVSFYNNDVSGRPWFGAVRSILAAIVTCATLVVLYSRFPSGRDNLVSLARAFLE